MNDAAPPDRAQCTYPAHEITGYRTSRDHAALADMATRRSVICIVDGDGTRNVAQTLWHAHPNAPGGIWSINGRGRCYVYATSLQVFLASCEQCNVEFLPPDFV